MAPKRSIRNLSSSTTTINNNYDKLLLSDVLCPICRSILIEPVTLPCNHGFCLSCFNHSMENTNLTCPLCRLRISSWIRTTRKEKKLVNQNLWNAIQKTFTKHVKDKLQGNEQYEGEDVHRTVTSAGEIRSEYEMQKAKELELQQIQQQAESKASEEYIKKLKEQEEYEERIRRENLRLSEQLAKKLANKYCFDPGPSSSKASVGPPIFSNKKQMQIDKFLINKQGPLTPKEYTCKVLNQGASNEEKELMKFINKDVKRKLAKIVEDTSDSNDSIVSECRFFKPIDRKFIPLATKVPIVKVPATIANANTVIIGAPKGKVEFAHSRLSSPFAMVRLTFPVNCATEISAKQLVNPECTSQKPIATKIANLKEAEPSLSFRPIFNHQSNTKSLNHTLIPSLTTINKSCTAISDMSNVDKFQPVSKRKRLVGSPKLEENIPIKPTKVSKTVLNSSVDIVNDVHSENIMINSNEINKSISNHCQEEDDFKLAVKLHKELNNSNRYPVRNNISLHLRNNRRSTRQVTLKEIISQATSI